MGRNGKKERQDSDENWDCSFSSYLFQSAARFSRREESPGSSGWAGRERLLFPEPFLSSGKCSPAVSPYLLPALGELLQVILGLVYLSSSWKEKDEVPRPKSARSGCNRDGMWQDVTVSCWGLGAENGAGSGLTTIFPLEIGKQNICFLQAINRGNIINFTWILMFVKLHPACRREQYLKKISYWGSTKCELCVCVQCSTVSGIKENRNARPWVFNLNAVHVSSVNWSW